MRAPARPRAKLRPQTASSRQVTTATVTAFNDTGSSEMTRSYDRRSLNYDYYERQRRLETRCYLRLLSVHLVQRRVNAAFE